MSFILQPIRPFEFTSPVFDHIKYRLLWLKPISSIIFANNKLRSLFTTREVNERIVEIPFVLTNLPRKGKILDVGACESPVSLMLASMGFNVWANDTRQYPFTHPNIHLEIKSVMKVDLNSSFDAVVCLSVLEHIGIDSYGNPESANLDKKSIQKMYSLLKDGGKLLLTTPIDLKHKNIYMSRVYTINELNKMLSDFSKIHIKVGYKDINENWKVDDNLPTNFHSFGEKGCAVALIEAIK